MTVSVGDTIRFTGFNKGCGTDQGPKLGSEGIVAEVLSGVSILVNWSPGVTAPTGGPAGRLLFSGEYKVTYRANPVDEPPSFEPDDSDASLTLRKPLPSVTLYGQQVGRALRPRPHGTCGVSPRAPRWQLLLNPDRWYWAPLAMLVGAMLGIYAGVAITEMGRV